MWTILQPTKNLHTEDESASGVGMSRVQRQSIFLPGRVVSDPCIQLYSRELWVLGFYGLLAVKNFQLHLDET